MNLLTVFSMVILGVVASLVLKQVNTTFSTVLTLLCGVLVLMAVLPSLLSLLEFGSALAALSGFEEESLRVLLKAIGTAYLAQFLCEACEAAGENSLVSKVEFAERLYLLTLSVPLIRNIMEVVEKVTEF